MTTTLNPPIAIEDVPRPYHWSVEAYYRADEAGAFYHWTADAFDRACDADVFEEPSRVELLQGRIIDKMGQGPLHSALAGYIADCLRAVMPERLTVREEKPIRIAFDGEPVPDLSVVKGNNLDFRQQHPIPEDIALLVEIAVTSSETDLSEKALLYAQAGIGDYWVVLPELKQVVVYRSASDTQRKNSGTRPICHTLARNASSKALVAGKDTPSRSCLCGPAPGIPISVEARFNAEYDV